MECATSSTIMNIRGKPMTDREFSPDSLAFQSGRKQKKMLFKHTFAAATAVVAVVVVVVVSLLWMVLLLLLLLWLPLVLVLVSVWLCGCVRVHLASLKIGRNPDNFCIFLLIVNIMNSSMCDACRVQGALAHGLWLLLVSSGRVEKAVVQCYLNAWSQSRFREIQRQCGRSWKARVNAVDKKIMAELAW